jgi:type I restriction enzyme, S subunit
MEVREGYKKTEIGVIPEDWVMKNLRDISIDMLQGVNTAIDIPEYVKSGFPMLKANDVIDGDINFGDVDQISYKTFRGYNIRFKPKKGDFLFSNIGARLGSGALLKEKIECSFAWNVMRIIPDKNQIIPEYLSSTINSPSFYKLVISNQTGSGMGFVPKSIIQKMSIPLPSLPEQKAIVEVLSDTDELIQTLEKKIVKKQLIKQGAMQKLLTPPSKPEALEGWEVKKLGEIAEFHKGKGLPKSEIIEEGKMKCIHYGELFTKYNEEIKEIISYTNTTMNVFFSKYNDVLMPTSDVTPNGLATASCINENNVVLGGDVLIIRVKIEVLKGTFLSYYISMYREQVMQLVTGSTVYHLYGSDMAKFVIKYPNLNEQTRIATILSDMDSEIEMLENKLAKFKKLKQGMMQELLTGKTRLV